MAKGKSPWFAVTDRFFWIWILSAHALIHAAAVFLVARNLYLAIAEFTCHWMIDLAKCAGKFGINTDQSLHVGCKVIWASF